jgi:Na(+)-translocating NADH:ubiquinone oxidoreductase A subunit
VGVLVVDVATCLAAHEACVEGKPLIERLVALGGTGYAEPGVVRARVGTPAKKLVEGRLVEPARVFADGALAGHEVTDADEPITRTTWGLTALDEDTSRPMLSWMGPGFDYDSTSRAFVSGFLPPRRKRVDTNLGGELRPCIQCGYCAEVCPRDLLPYQLDKLLAVDAIDEAEEMRLFGCVECGLCSYVCVSKIPLMLNIIKGKKHVLEEHEAERIELERKRAEEEARRAAETERGAQEGAA